MATQFIYASLSENGTVDGVKGDQTKNEVKVGKVYDFGQDTVLRFTNPSRATLFVAYCKIFADNNIVGYSQNDRYSLYTELQKRGFGITRVMNDLANKKFPKCNADCSSFVSAMLSLAYGKGLGVETTGSIVQALTRHYPSSFKLMKYDASKQKNGDIVLKANHHVVVVAMM